MITFMNRSVNRTLQIKDLVLLIGSNPPINFAPETITNYRLIETCLTYHGIKWGRLLPFDHKFSYNCTCIKPRFQPLMPTHPKPSHLLNQMGTTYSYWIFLQRVFMRWAKNFSLPSTAKQITTIPLATFIFPLFDHLVMIEALNLS